ncbi:DUF4395 domain-containing protein [Nocardia sp. NPDC127579]|uniref:DUF4395 domain-containing protein n=1 Tax=Nocardia sp. NPDC127579 TaxID=3345402 RepID=UPI00362F7B16
MPTDLRPAIPLDSVDVRGPRFAAWLTSTVLVLVLVLAAAAPAAAAPAAAAPAAAAVLLGAQAIVFALGALQGPRRSPYGRIYAALIAPRVGPVTETEPAAPLRFAQLLGLVFSAVGLLGFLAGSTVVGGLFVGFALFAAFLNAAFGICLGCQIYPLVTRLRRITGLTHPGGSATDHPRVTPAPN